jgi:hypothetical protein
MGPSGLWIQIMVCRLALPPCFIQEGNERNTAPFEGFDPLALEHSEMSEMH